MSRPLFPLALAAVVVLGGAALTPSPADAQILERIKRRTQEKVERRVERRVDQAIEKGIDTAEDAVVCVATDRACVAAAEQAGKPVVLTDAQGRALPPGAAAAPTAPGEGVWANYDFVPGERVLFADDLAADNVGDFPRRLEWLQGNAEVVEWQGRRLLRATSPTRFAIPLPEALGERFTVEFDVHDPETAGGTSLYTDSVPRNARSYPASYVNVGHWRGSGVWRDGNPQAAVVHERIATQVVRARVMADGQYVKVYLGETRVANVPRATLPRTGQLVFVLDGNPKRPIYLGEFRIAAGGRDLYDALAEHGRVATQGIYFATGSAELQPESTPTLGEIAAMLAEHADLRLTIEGHTDDVGDAAANQALSERRAAAVQAYLVAKHGVDAARLQSVGFGSARPAVPNTTPEARQQNRRVELVKR